MYLSLAIINKYVFTLSECYNNCTHIILSVVPYFEENVQHPSVNQQMTYV